MMADRSDARRSPRSFVAEGGEWPAGPFVPAASSAVFMAAELGRRLTMALRGKSLAQVASSAGVSLSVLEGVAGGDRWVRVHEAVALEEVLGCELLPRWRRGARGE